MHVDFLSAERTALTKTFTQHRDGTLEKDSYPLVHRFTSHRESITTLNDFYKAISSHAKQSHCLLKGQLTEALSSESRAGKTDRDAPTEWVCLDVDGIPNTTDIEKLLKEIPECSGVPYVLQHSSSSGIETARGLSVHVFMFLREPMEPATLKQWLLHLNLTIPLLRENVRLNRAGTTLKWPLDITTCQNDKLLYIAPPILKGLKDPLGPNRIKLVNKKANRLLAPDLSRIDSRTNEQERATILSALRKQHGFRSRPVATKVVGGFEVTTKPDNVTITDVKTERGFVYMNLNGGDSWAYFHPLANPDVIHNFKGEPSISTKDIAPDYWKQAWEDARRYKQEREESHRQEVVEQGTGTIYLAFRSAQDDQYYIGTYDAATDTANVRQTGNLTKLNHWLVEQGQGALDVVPTWDYEFRFDLPYVIDVSRKFLNKYSPPVTMRITPSETRAPIPPRTRTVLTSMLADDGEVLEHFLNWLAYIYQRREKPGTAWLLHGTQGTGKNLFFSRILAPIFGGDYCITSPLDALEDQFNQHLETSVFCLFNESDISTTSSQRKVMDRLNELITDDPISIRPMRGMRYKARSFTSCIINSNRNVAIEVARNDRRFNVAPRQEVSLGVLSDRFLRELDDEVVDFAQYLATYRVRPEAAHKPLDTESRRELQAISGNSIDDVAHALHTGDLQFFVDLLPDSAWGPGAGDAILKDRFRTTIEEAVLETLGRREHKVTRDQLHTIFSYCLENVPNSPHKFTRFLKHHAIRPVKLRKDGATPTGIVVHWKADRMTLDAMKHEVIKEVKRA